MHHQPSAADASARNGAKLRGQLGLNPTFQVQWAVGGTSQQYYSVDAETAAGWRAATDSEPTDLGLTA